MFLDRLEPLIHISGLNNLVISGLWISVLHLVLGVDMVERTVQHLYSVTRKETNNNNITYVSRSTAVIAL